jgi:hypothetical protein
MARFPHSRNDHASLGARDALDCGGEEVAQPVADGHNELAQPIALGRERPQGRHGGLMSGRIVLGVRKCHRRPSSMVGRASEPQPGAEHRSGAVQPPADARSEKGFVKGLYVPRTAYDPLSNASSSARN